jgi:hypothetical protein
MGAAGEVSGGVDGNALEEASVFCDDLLHGLKIALENFGGGVNGSTR